MNALARLGIIAGLIAVLGITAGTTVAAVTSDAEQTRQKVVCVTAGGSVTVDGDGNIQCLAGPR